MSHQAGIVELESSECTGELQQQLVNTVQPLRMNSRQQLLDSWCCLNVDATVGNLVAAQQKLCILMNREHMLKTGFGM